MNINLINTLLTELKKNSSSTGILSVIGKLVRLVIEAFLKNRTLSRVRILGHVTS
jgi:hypothetical protein